MELRQSSQSPTTNDITVVIISSNDNIFYGPLSTSTTVPAHKRAQKYDEEVFDYSEQSYPGDDDLIFTMEYIYSGSRILNLYVKFTGK